jgi:hypothetical protein
MKKSLLTITLLFTGLASFAQVVFNIESPASVSGNYGLSYVEAAGGWGSPDLLDPANSVTAELKFVEDGSPGTNPQGNPVSREGCNTLTNDLTGKIAVIYRNTCEFGTKAFNAQNAGAIAVIIVNRDDETIGMGPGADGASVTIPVIMVSSSTGLIISTLLNNNETIVGFIGNKLGLYADDLGLQNSKLLIPSANTSPSLLALSALENNKKLGAKLFNYGTNSQSNYGLKGSVTFGGSEVYNQTVNGPGTLASGDSATLFLPDFQLSSYPVGKYTLTYSVIMGASDEYAGDNSFSIDFYVTNDKYSFAQMNANDSIVSSQSFRTSATTSSFQACTHFQHPNASRTQLEGVYFAASVNDPSTLVDQEFIIHVYEWTDVFSDMNSVEFANLTELTMNEVATTTYSFASELENRTVYAPLLDVDLNPVSVTMTDNMRYLVCIETLDANTFIGYTNLDYDYVYDTLNQPISPILTDDGWSIGGFIGSPATSIGLKLVPNTTTPIITSNGLTNFCEGQSITLTSTSTSGNQWKKDGVNISGQTATTLVVSTSGSYTVVSNGNESDPVVVTVSAYPAAPIVTASDVTTFCQGGSVTLTSDVTSGNVWSDGSALNTLTVTESGNYSVTVYNGVCGTSSAVTTVTVNPLPAVEITAPGNTFAVCDGSSLDLTANGAVSYLWDGGETADVITVSPTSETQYSVTGTDANSCSNTTTVTVSALTAITPVIDASATAVCVGTEVTLLASNGATYDWTGTDGTTGSGNVLVVTPTSSADYTVNATLGNCTNSATVSITVNQLPTVVGSDLSGCVGTSVTLQASGALSYVWDNGIGAGNDIVISVPSVNTTYTVVGTDVNGCSNSDQVVVTATPLPTITFNPTTVSICSDSPALTLNDPTVTPSGGTGEFSGTGMNGNVFNPDGLPIGNNTVTYTATAGGCTTSANLTIQVANCASIDEVNAETVIVFPNPANDKLTIKTGNVSDYNMVVLTDQLGRTVVKLPISSNVTTIDVSNYAKGTYTLILTGLNTNKVQQVMIK